MMTDPYFYAAAVPAVIMVGLSKGGFGGAMALLGVPLMALSISPVQAAAILLPILIVMDTVSLWSWRSHRDIRTLTIMVPGALIGIGIGWATAAWVTVPMIRLIVGAVALWFVWRYVVQKLAEARSGDQQAALGHRPVQGVLWGALAGFTSFVSHAGGPPYQIYTLPLRQDPRTLYRNQRPFLCHHQCAQAGSLFRARAVRHHQSVDISGAGAACPGGDACRRILRPAHEAGRFLSVHVCDGVPRVPETDLGRGCSPIGLMTTPAAGDLMSYA